MKSYSHDPLRILSYPLCIFPNACHIQGCMGIYENGYYKRSTSGHVNGSCRIQAVYGRIRAYKVTSDRVEEFCYILDQKILKSVHGPPRYGLSKKKQCENCMLGHPYPRVSHIALIGKFSLIYVQHFFLASFLPSKPPESF